MPYETPPEFLVKAPLYRPERFPAAKVGRHANGGDYIEANTCATTPTALAR